MHKLLTTLAAAAALFSVGAIHANAMPLNGPAGIRAATEELNIVDNVQFVWNGRRFCFYDDGWNGPGWYWCDNYLTRGIGWGGAVGFRGWRRPGGVAVRGAGPRAPVARAPVVRAAPAAAGPRPGGPGRHSDIAVKHDVALLGWLDNGLGLYRFSYNGDDKVYVGVIAQEVAQVMPDAVTRGSDGVLRVFYDRIGVKFQTYEQWLAGGQKIPAVQH
jgi:Chaperone of endosialidase